MSERLSWSEAEAVVRAYRAEHGMASDVEIATLAKTLGTSPAEIRRLAGRRHFTDRSGVLSALLSIGVLAVAALILGPSFLAKNPEPRISHLHPTPANRMTKVVIVSDGDGRVHALDRDDDSKPGLSEVWTYPIEERATLLLPDEKTL